MDYLKQILFLDTFEAFVLSSISNNAVFGLKEKQDVLINNEYSFWYHRIGDFLLLV